MSFDAYAMKLIKYVIPWPSPVTAGYRSIRMSVLFKCIIVCVVQRKVNIAFIRLWIFSLFEANMTFLMLFCIHFDLFDMILNTCDMICMICRHGISWRLLKITRYRYWRMSIVFRSITYGIWYRKVNVYFIVRWRFIY